MYKNVRDTYVCVAKTYTCVRAT